MGGLLFDLDGVIYNGEVAIEGAAEAIAWVREQGIPHLFLTNASSRGRGAIAEKLTRMGIPTAVTQIMSPAAAAADWHRKPAAVAQHIAEPEQTAGHKLAAHKPDVKVAEHRLAVRVRPASHNHHPAPPSADAAVPPAVQNA